MDGLSTSFADWPVALRLIVFAGVAGRNPRRVMLIRRFANRALESSSPRQFAKLRTIGTLGDDESKASLEHSATELMHAAHEQFPGILIAPPPVEGEEKTAPRRTAMQWPWRRK